jgi:uncharacterized membrane protein
MSASLYLWVLPAHIIGLFLWMGGLFAVYWLLRVHSSAPKEVHEKLVLMERSLALMMDIAATLAIGTGLALALAHPQGNLFGLPHHGWLHAKLTIVVLGILSVHGMTRARIKKFSQGKISDVPQWQWSLLLVAIVAIVILVERRPF